MLTINSHFPLNCDHQWIILYPLCVMWFILSLPLACPETAIATNALIHCLLSSLAYCGLKISHWDYWTINCLIYCPFVDNGKVTMNSLSCIKKMCLWPYKGYDGSYSCWLSFISFDDCYTYWYWCFWNCYFNLRALLWYRLTLSL